MSSSAVAFVVAAVAVVASLAFWRVGRRADAGYLKKAAVSRQWLIEHQGEDRS